MRMMDIVSLQLIRQLPHRAGEFTCLAGMMTMLDDAMLDEIPFASSLMSLATVSTIVVTRKTSITHETSSLPAASLRSQVATLLRIESSASRPMPTASSEGTTARAVRRAQQELYPHDPSLPRQRQLGLGPSLWNMRCSRPHHPRLAALHREALTQTLRSLLLDP